MPNDKVSLVLSLCALITVINAGKANTHAGRHPHPQGPREHLAVLLTCFLLKHLFDHQSSSVTDPPSSDFRVLKGTVCHI